VVDYLIIKIKGFFKRVKEWGRQVQGRLVRVVEWASICRPFETSYAKPYKRQTSECKPKDKVY
jgi:hypothetical protein